MRASFFHFPRQAHAQLCRACPTPRNYPGFLYQILTMPAEDTQSGIGVDICFKDLSLAVHVAGKSVNVVDHVSGRVKAKTMTALMGGSGAG